MVVNSYTEKNIQQQSLRGHFWRIKLLLLQPNTGKYSMKDEVTKL
jgi:hypothetical protein